MIQKRQELNAGFSGKYQIRTETIAVTQVSTRDKSSINSVH